MEGSQVIGHHQRLVLGHFRYPSLFPPSVRRWVSGDGRVGTVFGREIIGGFIGIPAESIALPWGWECCRFGETPGCKTWGPPILLNATLEVCTAESLRGRFAESLWLEASDELEGDRTMFPLCCIMA